jgi:hypothetical protein
MTMRESISLIGTVVRFTKLWDNKVIVWFCDVIRKTYYRIFGF